MAKGELLPLLYGVILKPSIVDDQFILPKFTYASLWAAFIFTYNSTV